MYDIIDLINHNDTRQRFDPDGTEPVPERDEEEQDDTDIPGVSLL